MTETVANIRNLSATLVFAKAAFRPTKLNESRSAIVEAATKWSVENFGKPDDSVAAVAATQVVKET